MENTSTSLREKAISCPTFSHKLLKKPFLLITLLAVFLLSACEKEIEEIHKPPADISEGQVPTDILEKIKALGFGTKGVKVIPEGYLVEGDIILRKEDLRGTKNPSNARINQYRTLFLVTNLPRTITVSMASNLPASYNPALEEAIKRYNDLGLRLSFRRVTSDANISIVKGSGDYLASAGFPTILGDPYNQINVNTTEIGTDPDVQYLATILAHEIGHCIGFRHTDFMNRSYSCKGAFGIEDIEVPVGVVHVPGTPTIPDPDSWMLACIGYGTNRPFNTADQLSLRTLYGQPCFATLPCIHMVQQHSNGDNATVPCTHGLRQVHPNGDNITVPCTHGMHQAHSNGDNITVPCIHWRQAHPEGHKNWLGIWYPCPHMIQEHPNGDNITVPCTHMELVHPNGDNTTVPCVHLELVHPNGDNITVPCPHMIQEHPDGDRGPEIPCT